MLKPEGSVVVIESVFGVSKQTTETKNRETSHFVSLTSHEQKQVNMFFDHFYNRILYRDVHCPFSFDTPDGWRSRFETAGLREETRRLLGIDQPIVPEFHTLHVFRKNQRDSSLSQAEMNLSAWRMRHKEENAHLDQTSSPLSATPILNQTRLKNYCADTLSTLIYATIVARGADILVLGSTPSQALTAWLVSLPVNLSSARMQGLYRDKLFKSLQITHESSALSKIGTDTLAMTSFRGGIYIGTALMTNALAGADFPFSSIIRSAGVVLLTLAVTGRPFGIFRNWIRKRFGLPTVG